MNGIHSVGSNQVVQTTKAAQKPTTQQQKSNVGKYVGVSAGAVGGATGTYFLNSFVNENRDSVFKYLENKLNYIAQKFPVVADEIKFFSEQGTSKLNDILTKVKWGAGTALIVVPTLVGLGVGAIVDLVRNKNKSAK